MKKKLYYQLSDNADVNNIIIPLTECADWIECDMADCKEGEDRIYTITPIWLTDAEFEALPEAEF